MKSLLASARSIGGLDRVDHAVQLLEDEWRRHGDVPLDRLWAEQKRLMGSEPGESTVLLAELVRTDLRCRFARGQTPTVAGYLERFPELDAADSRVLSLIYEEFCLVEERGDRVDVEAFCQRYPRWKRSLVWQVQCHHLLSQAAGVRPKPTPFPESGDTFEEFELVSLLGRGGSSRVFLARDLSLGGKQVVLKVSLDHGREPQAQGALDHPHIVPVNAVVFSGEGMRGLSMPYRAGLPLDEVIRRVNPASRPPRAMALWEALVRPNETTTEPGAKPEAAAPVESRAAGPRGDGWEGFPVRGTFAQGVAWVGKVIADALHYAHGQQTFHRDVKPANVLLTVQHGPQLLDFNLAESPHSVSQAQAAMKGGTLPYMAPEQIEAFLNPDLWGNVGAPADIYSLGLVLRELLTGQAPDLPAETLALPRAMRVLLDRRPLLDVSVRRSNPAIPHALEAIVAKCLAVPLGDRYPDAGALAEDLDRFLRFKPLARAVNPSPVERLGNWRRRNRARLAVAAICLAFLLGGMVLEGLRTPKRPSVAIDKTQELIDAVSALNEGKTLQSRALFHRLADWYPRSGIPKVYLGLAYDLSGHPEEAERGLSEARNHPGAAAELVAWSPKDPQLQGRLRRFAKHRFQKAFLIQGDKEFDEAEQGKTLADQYQLAMWTLDISRRIRVEGGGHQPANDEETPGNGDGEVATEAESDPDLPDYDLAIAAQEVGEYEWVIRMASRAIKRIGDKPAADGTGELRFARRLSQWRRLRARAYTKLAERQREGGSKTALLDASKSIQNAENDLKVCSHFTSNQVRNTKDLHYLQRIRVAALLTRVEIDIDLGQLVPARSHLNKARDSLRSYEEIARVVDETHDIDAKNARLSQIARRLRDEEAKRNAEPRRG
jgi:serine/threonine protein kinase